MRRFLTDIIKILNTFFFSSSETSEFHQNAIEVIYKQLSQAKKKKKGKKKQNLSINADTVQNSISQCIARLPHMSPMGEKRMTRKPAKDSNPDCDLLYKLICSLQSGQRRQI